MTFRYMLGSGAQSAVMMISLVVLPKKKDRNLSERASLVSKLQGLISDATLASALVVVSKSSLWTVDHYPARNVLIILVCAFTFWVLYDCLVARFLPSSEVNDDINIEERQKEQGCEFVRVQHRVPNCHTRC